MPRNKSDRLYVTQTEHSGVYGRHTAGNSGQASTAGTAAQSSQYQPYVPFDCCAISLQQWVNPVADKADGTIYELTNVLPWIKKHGVSPASGLELQVADLVTLNFSKNEATSQWHDPVSFKTFNDSTHMVAVATSGNVYTWDTVQQLNVKAKYWSDLVTGESFTRKDIIVLQDPNNASGKKQVADLHHLKEKMTLTAADKGQKEDNGEVNIAATGSAASLLKKIRQQKEGDEDKKKQAGQSALDTMQKAAGDNQASIADVRTSNTDRSQASVASSSKLPYNAGTTSTGRTAASFTSTGLTPRTKTERELISEEEMMYDEIRNTSKGKSPAKGYVRIVTNFGPLNLELHADKAPRTCYNFLTLCSRGYYTDSTMHRNIPGFMIQGGDPTGSGRGGESMWGKPFSDEWSAPGAYGHSERGALSMANRGPDTNGSQFFITYAPKKHLDRKHTVFGRLVDSPSATLDALEKVPTEAGTDRPLRTIRILHVQVFSDPFQVYQEKLQKKLGRDEETEVKKREEKRRKREEDRTTWFGTSLEASGRAGEAEASPASNGGALSRGGTTVQGQDGVGRYLKVGKQQPRTSATQSTTEIDAAAPEPKKRKTSSFGDFSSW
ncbi:unnamed protein product [Jaminaea pallidilutea]